MFAVLLAFFAGWLFQCGAGDLLERKWASGLFGLGVAILVLAMALKAIA